MRFWERILRRCQRNFRPWLLIPLVALLCFSMVLMGTLFWVDNSWALIIDSDPETRTELGLLLAGGLTAADEAEFDADGDGVVPVPGGLLIKGNGDQDDNREKPFLLARASVFFAPPVPLVAVSSFRERRTVIAYKDFGHLKLMSADSAAVTFGMLTF